MKDFKQFDSVSEISDHHYARSNLKGKELEAKVTKKIMKEWKILEENLPDSIFVRVYEERIDLLRAVIIGPPTTPYYNGLFFFDFCFPKDYPARPPTVYYHSFGMRLNPNLYASGYVCLSLLNTWSGPRWNKNQSTILQVLLSLQALVLNEKPFFNEPGFETFKLLLKKQAVAYSEDTWILTCKTMIHLLKKPPKHFEEFVNEHFRAKAETILVACKAYMAGEVKVGDVVHSENPSSPVYRVSQRFQTSMHDLYPLLLNWFADKGAPVEKYRAEVQFLSKSGVIIKRGDGIAKKSFAKLKRLFGCSVKIEDNKDKIVTDG